MNKKNKHTIISAITLITLTGTIYAGGDQKYPQTTMDRLLIHTARNKERQLARAIESQNLTLVQQLLEAGADAAGYDDNFTPLIQVALMQECPITTTALPTNPPVNLEIVHLLIAHGAQTKETNMSNQSAIDIANEIGDPALIAALQ